MIPARIRRPAQITMRSMAVSLIWLSACLALWTAESALELGYPILLGWLALCTGLAALFGKALRFVLVMVVGVSLFFLGVVLLVGLSRLMPDHFAMILVLFLVTVACISVHVSRQPHS